MKFWYCFIALALFGASVSFAGSSPVKLNDPNVPIEQRVKEAKALGRDKSPAAIDTLLAGLDVRDEELHAAIAESLKALKADELLLQRAADTKRAMPDRVNAFAGLRALKPADKGAKVAAFLDAKEEPIREAAAFALCVFGTAAAEDKLIRALSDASPKVRYFVATALGELKTPAAKNAVEARLKLEKDFAVIDALEQSKRRAARPSSP
jgi:HEAT repeat protein